MPMPGSTIRVARLPTTIPTFGTIGTSSSGITNTCSEILTVVRSFTTGAGCAATEKLRMVNATAGPSRFMKTSFRLNADVLDDLAEPRDVAPHERAPHRLVQTLGDR